MMNAFYPGREHSDHGTCFTFWCLVMVLLSSDANTSMVMVDGGVGCGDGNCAIVIAILNLDKVPFEPVTCRQFKLKCC